MSIAKQHTLQLHS